MNYSELQISFDWLQLYLKGCYTKSEKYTYKKLDFGTRIFQIVEEIYKDKIFIGTICYSPLSKILRPDCHIIKFDNKLLYFDYLFDFIDEFLHDHSFEVHGITRLDLAIDFNTFQNNLHPANLILKFLTNEYLRVNKGKYKLIGEQFFEQTFQYLRFGTNTSEVSAYLYNKSIEMKQKKFKQYIFNKWQAQGLDTDMNVWRLEFSLKTNSIRVDDKNTGEIWVYSYLNLRGKSFLKALFSTLLYNYFRFVINDGCKKKARMKNVELISNVTYDFDLTHITLHEDNGRMDKIFLRMIENFNCEMRENKQWLSDELSEEIVKFAQKKRLDHYYYDRVCKEKKNNANHTETPDGDTFL